MRSKSALLYALPRFSAVNVQKDDRVCITKRMTIVILQCDSRKILYTTKCVRTFAA
jgi:hypothetical protein